MSAETATRTSRAMRSSPALADDPALEDTPFSETEDAMRFRASRAELRMLLEARAREDDAIVAKAERDEPLTAEEIVLRARARRDAALRLQRQLDDAVAAAQSTLARWDARGFHRDARFGDAVLANLRRNLETTKAEVARRVAEELPGILAARRQREREEAAERERRRREDEGRDEVRAERPLRTLFADRPVSPPPEPESTNEEVARLADDDARDSHEHDSRRSSSAFRAPAEANQSAEDPSSDCFDDTGDASYDVEAERAAWNAELERRRAALEAERAALEASNEATTSSKSADPTRSSPAERSSRLAALEASTLRVFERRGEGNLYEPETLETSVGEACAAVVALIRSIAPGDGEPVPESFASGAFMAVTTRTDAPLSESEIASAEAQLRDAQDPDGARMFHQLLAHFKSLVACRAMEPRRAARALADATIPTGNSDAARRALVDRFAQLLRALIGEDTNEDRGLDQGRVDTGRDEGARDAAHRDDSRRRSVPLGGVLGDALGAPHANAKTNTTSKTVTVGTGVSSSSVLVGGARIARGRRASGGGGLNLSGSTFAAPARADLDESDELEAQLRGLPSPTETRVAAEERRRATAGATFAEEIGAASRVDARAGAGLEARGEEDEDASANPGGHRSAEPAADALDESSFSADDSTVSDAPVTASRTTNARVGSAMGRGTGKGPAIAGPTNVGSILTRAMRDESDTDASSSDRSRLLGGGSGGGGDDDESDSFDF